jgi:hypothetical protein
MKEELTDIIRRRTMELVSKEEGLVMILFNDHSTLQIKTISGPGVNRQHSYEKRVSPSIQRGKVPKVENLRESLVRFAF